MAIDNRFEAGGDINVAILNLGPGKRVTVALLCFLLGALVPLAPFLGFPVILATLAVVTALALDAKPHPWEQRRSLTSIALPAAKLVFGAAALGFLGAALAGFAATGGASCWEPLRVLNEQKLRNALAVIEACVSDPESATCKKATTELLGGSAGNNGGTAGIVEAANVLKPACTDDGDPKACSAVGKLYYFRRASEVLPQDTWNYNRRACELGDPDACLRLIRLLSEKRHEPAADETPEHFASKTCALKSEEQCKAAAVLLAAIEATWDRLELACFDAPTMKECAEYYLWKHRDDDTRILCDRDHDPSSCYNYALHVAQGKVNSVEPKSSISYIEKACLLDPKRFVSFCENKESFVEWAAPTCYPKANPRCEDEYLEKDDYDMLRILCDEHQVYLACWNVGVDCLDRPTVCATGEGKKYLQLACENEPGFKSSGQYSEAHLARACPDLNAFVSTKKKK